MSHCLPLLCLFTASIATAAPARPRAAIDMGSSSAKLLIQDRTGRVIVDEKRSTALGKEIGADRLLPRANQARAIDALSHFVEVARAHGIAPGEIEMVTTAAVRNADGKIDPAARLAGKKSGTAFIDEDVRGRLGLTRARILSGDDEARLGHQGALARYLGRGARGTRYAVLDTGGGSHQVIAGTIDRILADGSTQIGSNYVMEKVMVDAKGARQETFTPAELAAIDVRMAQHVPALPIAAQHLAGAEPVAIGGTSKFLAAYFGRAEVSRADIESLRREVAALPVKDRGARLSVDHAGRPFDEKVRVALGLHAPIEANQYGEALPAKTTLLLRLMTLLGKTAPGDTLALSDTDARHALIAGAR